MLGLGTVVLHYAAMGVFGVVSYVVGRRLLCFLVFDSALEQVCFSTALGAGFLAYLVFFLGLLGLLYMSLLIPVLLLILAGCYPVWKGWQHGLVVATRQFTSAGRSRLLVVSSVVLLALVLSLPLWVLPLYPPTAFDETLYHLRAAREYVEHHRVLLTPYVRYPVFPQTNEMLFTVALLVGDDILAHLFQFALMVILGAALVAFGRRFFSTRAGWWSAALLLANPLVLWCGSVSYIEIGLMLFVTMSVYAFCIWWQTRADSWLVVAGIFCGLAAGTKYNALFFLGLLQIAALYAGLKARRSARALTFGMVTVAVALPWLARNFYYTRNPVFPYFYWVFGPMFGPGLFDPEHYAGMTSELSRYGVGSDLRSLLSLPWHLTFNQQPFVMEAPLSSLYFYLLPCVLAGAILVARVRYLLTLIIAYTLFWFFSAQVLRYFLPILPLLSLATAAAVAHLADKALRKWKTAGITTALGVALLISPGWIYATREVRRRGVPPVTASERKAYLTARLPSYGAYDLLNGLKGADYTLYSYHDENMNYFAAGVFIGDWFGAARYEMIDRNLESGQMLYNQLKSFGADYLLTRVSERIPELPKDEFFNSHFRLIYSRPSVVLYQIVGKDR